MPDDSSVTDVDIIIALQEDDPRAGLRMLFEQQGGKVLGWLKKKYKGVLDEPEIESAMNLAVAKFWKYAPQYDESKGTLGAVFFVFARNAAVSVLRGQVKHYQNRTDFEAILSDDIAESVPCDDPPPDSKRGRLLSDFERAVASLPPAQQAIVRADLAAGGAADNDRLAERLGCAKASIYTNRTRAHENLRKRMIELGHYRA
jgi:DNA-directed RNA polymerase specialized sigma24 family protein